MDTSAIIPSIITNGLSRRILVQAEIEFHTPEDAVRELWETQKSWNRGGLTPSTLREIVEALFTRIRIVGTPEFSASIHEAYSIMKKIDANDSPFLALAIHLDCPLWSNEKHFKRQGRVLTYTTSELGKLLGIE